MSPGNSAVFSTAGVVRPPRVERVARGWLKRAEPEPKNPWRKVVRYTTTLVPWPLLRSTATTGDLDSVRAEARRLRQWRAAGLPVPELLEAAEDHIVVAHAGESLREWLAREPVVARRLEAVVLAARSLGQLHRTGFCHGRPFLKDLVYDGRQVTFIDLEEEPSKVMPLLTAQVRDVMLFIMSCAALLGAKHPAGDLRLVADAYRAANPSPELQRSLRRNLRALWWAALPLRLCPTRWLGRDGRQAVSGLAALRRLAR